MRSFALSLAAVTLLAGPAFAQGVMTPGAMPPPPSASEPRPKAERATETKKRQPRRARAETGEPTLRTPPVATGSGYRERIDTRPGGGALQLEDDPRAVRPIMQNGRPGMGMRF